MKKTIFALLATILFTACMNEHRYFAKGVVVTHSADLIGVYLEVDTTYDGVADIDVEVIGTDMAHRFQKGDSVSLDIRTETSYATPIIERDTLQ